MTKILNDVPQAAQVRLIAVIEALAGNEITGLQLKEVVSVVGDGCNVSTIYRALKALESVGWAQQHNNGRWTLGSRPFQLLNHFHAGLKAIQERTAEVAANYTRIPL